MKQIKEHIMRNCKIEHRLSKTAFTVVLSVLILFLSFGLMAVSYYYHEPFNNTASAQTAGWNNITGTANQGHPVGRDGLFNATGTVYGGFLPEAPSIIGVNNGRLYLIGRPNNGELLYNNIWVGKAAQFIPANSATFGNTNLRATAENPLGFQIMRTYAYVDPNGEAQGETQYNRSGLTLWMVQDSSTVVNEWDNYANFVYMYDQTSMNWDGAADTARIGWFDGTEHFPVQTGVTNMLDYSNYDITRFYWQYDDNTGTDYSHLYPGFTEPITANNNAVIFRMTHDGSTVNYYLNPNPYGTNAGPLSTAPNTFVLIGKSQVSWNDNIKFMLGHETMYFLNESADGEYDDFLIRSVCDTLLASITPQRVVVDQTNTFKVTVVPTFNANDSGIGEILIKKPAYITSSWDLDQIFVTNASSGSFAQLTKAAGTLPANNGEFAPSVTPDGLLRILYRTTDSGSGVINSSSANLTNVIVFKILMPAGASSDGGDFQVFANLEKYDGWAYTILNLPTTGKKKALPAATDALKVKSYRQPYANASVTAAPAVINQGTVDEAESVFSYELSTRDISGRPPISQAIIAFPSNFVVYQTNIKSLYIYNDTANISLTNGNGSNYIVLNYTEGALPGEGGYDRITFTGYGTPQIAQDATNEKFKFVSWINSSNVVGASLQSTGTNSAFPSQMVTIAAPDPVVAAGIFPKSLKNSDRTNTMTYTIRNNGTTYNKVYQTRIYFNTTYVDSVSDISSDYSAAVTTGPDYIQLVYDSPLTSGNENQVSFKMVHKITNLVNPDTTVLFNATADNRNGKGYISASQNSLGWDVTFVPPDPRGESYLMPETVYTSDITNTVNFYIYNAGPAGDKIFQARIVVPDIFTNFTAADVSSAYLSMPGSVIKTNISGTNYIWVKYYAESTNIGSLNDVVGQYPHDTVTLKLAKPIQSATNRIDFKVWAENRTNQSFITNFSSTNLTGTYSTNQLHLNLEFPPVSASFDVQSRFTNDYGATPVEQFGQIDATTMTNYVQIRITNTGVPGNYIRRVRIELPQTVFTNIVPGSMSSLLVSSSAINYLPSGPGTNAQIVIDYTTALPATNIGSQMSDTISVQLIDKLASAGNATFRIYVENDREEAKLTEFIPDGYTDSLNFIVPPAQAAGKIEPKVFFTTAGTNESDSFIYTVTNTGGGSNNLEKVVLQIPALFQNKVKTVTNQMNTVIVTNNSEIQIYYTNVNLTPGDTDKIFISVDYSYNDSALSSVTWEMTADNSGSIGDSTETVSGGSKVQYATVRPYFNVFEQNEDDHNVYASNVTNDINIKFYNGTNVNGQKIHRVKVTVPEPFNMPYLDASASQGSPVLSYNGRDVIITYTTPLNEYSFDTLQLKVVDNFEEDETNTGWQVQADYGDGIWRDMFSNGVIEGVNFTNQLAVVLPDAEAQSFLEPDTLFVNNTSQIYSLTVTNKGMYGNTIRLIEIRPPWFITNMLTFSSTKGSISNWKHPATNIWYVQYTADKLNINSSDTITFEGFDSAVTASGSEEQWYIRVVNSTNTNRLVNAPAVFGKTLTTQLTLPSQRTEFYAQPESVDTTAQDVTYSLYVNNKSPQIYQTDSNIKKIKISLTNGLFRTNGIAISSLKTGAYTVDQTGDNVTIVFDYSTNLIPPKQSDLLTVTLQDTVTNGNTNAFWHTEVMYDTTEPNYVSPLVVDGTNRIAFTMPVPSITSGWDVSDIYTTATNADLTLRLTNTGQSSHLLTALELTIPGEWHNRLYNVKSVLGSSSVSYDGTNIRILYSNFGGQTNDTVTFSISNNVTTVKSLNVTGTVSNISRSIAVSVPVEIKTPPTAQVAPSSVNTGVVETNGTITVRNFSTSGYPLRAVMLKMPDIVTNITGISSQFDSSAVITNNGSNWYIFYSTPLPQSGQDSISFSFSDSINAGDTNIIWTVLADNGTGFAPLSESESGALEQAFIQHAPMISYAFLNNEIFTTADNAQLVMAISNIGVGDSPVNNLSVSIPSVWQDKISAVNSVLGSAAVTNNVIRIDYSAFTAGNVDQLSFTLSNTVATPTNLDFTVVVSNAIRGTNGAPAFDNANTLKVVPAPKCYLDLLQIDTSSLSNRIIMKIENSGNGFKPINQIRIQIPQIYNQYYSIVSSSGTVTNSSNEFFITYSSGLGQGETDTVTLSLGDQLESGNSNISWQVAAQNGNGFAPVAAKNSGALNQSFIMPDPNVKMNIVYNELYTTATNTELYIEVTNMGSGSNKLKDLVLIVPTDYVGSIQSYTSLFTEAIQFSGNELHISYTNTVAAVTDRIVLRMDNNITSITGYQFQAVASNQNSGSAVSADINKDTLFIVSPPTGRLEPLSIKTTDADHQIKLYINNNSSGGLPVLGASVTVPAVFQSISSINSSILGSVPVTNGNQILLDYTSSPLNQGETDIITFNLSENFDYGSSNVAWICRIQNGNGWHDIQPYSSGSLTNSLYMPAVAATGWLNKTWLYAVSTSIQKATNQFSVTFTNSGSGSNNVYAVKLTIPEVLSNISAASSLQGGNITLLNDTNLIVTYTNTGLLQTGQSDTVSFQLVHNIDIERSCQFGFYADNGDGNGFTSIATPAGDDQLKQRLDIVMAEESPICYIAGAKPTYMWQNVTNRTIYTMDNVVEISMVLKNRSKKFDIKSVVLDLSNIYTVTNVVGSSKQITYSHVTNRLFITFAEPLNVQAAETFKIYAIYDSALQAATIDNNGPITNDIAAQIEFSGNSEYSAAETDGRGLLILDNATFGRYIGTVQPFDSGSTVTLKYTSTDSLATNSDGTAFSVTINTNTGLYVVDKIPAGSDYSLVVLPPTLETQTNNDGSVYSPVSYQTKIITGMSALMNTISYITNLQLSYDRLNYLALGTQIITSQDDPATQAIFPPDSLFQGMGLNIGLDKMSTQQLNAMTASGIANPGNPTTLSNYHFEIKDLSDNAKLENGMKGDVEIVLHYDADNVISQGWNENDLAIYYWKPTTQRWVKIGGTLDAASDTVKAKVSYLHAYYAVMAPATQSQKAIRDVKISPNPFTPGRGGDQFTKAKLTFTFNKPYSEYQVKIFDMRGRLIRKFVRDGSYAQGEVFWDGLNDEGFNVPGGVYLYQIHAGSNVFTGTVLVLK